MPPLKGYSGDVIRLALLIGDSQENVRRFPGGYASVGAVVIFFAIGTRRLMKRAGENAGEGLL